MAHAEPDTVRCKPRSLSRHARRSEMLWLCTRRKARWRQPLQLAARAGGAAADERPAAARLLRAAARERRADERVETLPPTREASQGHAQAGPTTTISRTCRTRLVHTSHPPAASLFSSPSAVFHSPHARTSARARAAMFRRKRATDAGAGAAGPGAAGSDSASAKESSRPYTQRKPASAYLL
jgi:hypothetical protein